MSQDTVLDMLRSGAGGFLSGEELSRRLGQSRTAIWKAVDALRRKGYDIEARAGQGYRLNATPDALTEAELRSFLPPTEVVGRVLWYYEEIDSTNSCAKRLYNEDAPDGVVIAADCQTAGRGRMNRSFQSPRGKGIYLSVLLRPGLPPGRLTPSTAMAGVAVCDAVEKVCGVRPKLKWPNDPVLEGKKLCGILTEASMEAEIGLVDCLIIGIGVNVGQTAEDFTPEVAEMATSLYLSLGRTVSRPALAAALIAELDQVYAALRSGEWSRYLEAYRRDCVNVGKPVRLLTPDGRREDADAIGVDPAFGLVVRGADGSERTIRAGEVSVRGLYGYAE